MRAKENAAGFTKDVLGKEEIVLLFAPTEIVSLVLLLSGAVDNDGDVSAVGPALVATFSAAKIDPREVALTSIRPGSLGVTRLILASEKGSGSGVQAIFTFDGSIWARMTSCLFVSALTISLGCLCRRLVSNLDHLGELLGLNVTLSVDSVLLVIESRAASKAGKTSLHRNERRAPASAIPSTLLIKVSTASKEFDNSCNDSA